MSWTKISAWAGGVTASVAVVVAMAWGVPHYIATAVHEDYSRELAETQVENAAKGPVMYKADHDASTVALAAQLDGIENRMIQRDKMFIDYLERQAQLAAARGN